MKQSVLNDVSLCAIVRDEIMNPAGGIEDFIRCTIPYVEAAIVLDTGSKDGTWEKLQELQREYPRMEIFQEQFTDYAGMRNLALGRVKTSMVLVLDADERLFPEDFRELAKLVNSMKRQKRTIGINLVFWWVRPNKRKDFRGGGHNPRLFRILPDIHFRNHRDRSKEYLYLGDFMIRREHGLCLDSPVEIKHFAPSSISYATKIEYWYDGIVDKGRAGAVAPSEVAGFGRWKKLNPRRAQFA